MMPRPAALRLVTRAERLPRASLPFRLASWTPDAAGIAVWLEATGEHLDDAAIAAQLPLARDLAPATPVFVLGSAVRAHPASWFPSLRSTAVKVGRAPRCGALLMRGYVGLGAGLDETSSADLVWGFSSLC
jgi:hypothetical protein